MEVMHERCCGLDVHKKSVTACIISPEGRQIQTFGTMTKDLLDLADWITSKGCTHVAMESTGIYWKPIYNLLEDQEIEVLVVNAQHIKAVPGRKTDVKDAEWIAMLLRHGLLRGSYIPDRSQRELRELTRYRRSLIEERAREVSRIQKVLEGGNIKLGDVATDVLGKSGREMLKAIISGKTNTNELTDMARGKLKKKREHLKQALDGLLGEHQRMMLATQLRHIEYLEQEIERLHTEIEKRMRPFELSIQAIDEIPGIGREAAEEILAEIGSDMDRFPNAAHISSWAGLCPGNNESAGKRKTGKTRKGNPHLRASLVRAARSAARTKGSYLSSLYNRLAGRRGGNRAAVAVAHALLVIIYHMLKKGTAYEDLGPNHFDQINKEAAVRRSVKHLETLGYKVILEAA
ncbi:MAG: IS110 family transposase [Syntrophothermus sp.]